MKSILFVCLGNICRSPMAEAVMRAQIAEQGLAQEISVDSAGTGDWHLGKPPHEGTLGLLTQRGISCAGMAARQVRREDFDQYDYIVCMDTQNRADLAAWEPKQPARAQVLLFMDLVAGGSNQGWSRQYGRDVPDPYYTGNFEEVYALVEAGCARLLEQVSAALAR